MGAQSEKEVPMRNCYRLTIRHGYVDEGIARNLSMLMFEQIRNYVIHKGA